ncbi:hypothetical protein E4U43_008078 [Claviceps pusilla]|uniref:Uncharacterized protein n=1 Tax=Claviceps pusilla TaxID=123648 RepID=A0A9P7T3Q6_9HYPO|nr:hypothetical protein E4U43_008078 [Claviceps pusilla]
MVPGEYKVQVDAAKQQRSDREAHRDRLALTEATVVRPNEALAELMKNQDAPGLGLFDMRRACMASAWCWSGHGCFVIWANFTPLGVDVVDVCIWQKMETSRDKVAVVCGDATVWAGKAFALGIVLEYEADET